MATLFIHLEGGIVQDVYCDRPDLVSVVMIDRDTEDCEIEHLEEDRTYCKAEDAFIHEYATSPSSWMHPELLGNIAAHLGWPDE